MSCIIQTMLTFEVRLYPTLKLVLKINKKKRWNKVNFFHSWHLGPSSHPRRKVSKFTAGETLPDGGLMPPPRTPSSDVPAYFRAG